MNSIHAALFVAAGMLGGCTSIALPRVPSNAERVPINKFSPGMPPVRAAPLAKPAEIPPAKTAFSPSEIVIFRDLDPDGAEALLRASR